MNRRVVGLGLDNIRLEYIISRVIIKYFYIISLKLYKRVREVEDFIYIRILREYSILRN